MKFLSWSPVYAWMARADPGFFIREAPKLRTNRTSAPVGWVQWVSERDVPPQKWRKKINFWSKFARFGAFFFAYGAHTNSGGPSLQKIGRGASHTWMGPFSSCWFTYLFPSWRLLSFLLFPFFSLFSLLSLSFLGAPLVIPGAGAPKPPPGYAPDLTCVCVCVRGALIICVLVRHLKHSVMLLVNHHNQIAVHREQP